jgi:hypothetical protein
MGTTVTPQPQVVSGSESGGIVSCGMGVEPTPIIISSTSVLCTNSCTKEEVYSRII